MICNNKFDKINSSKDLIKLIEDNKLKLNFSQFFPNIINTIYHKNKAIIINTLYNLSKKSYYYDDFIILFMSLNKNILFDIANNYANKKYKKIINNSFRIGTNNIFSKFEINFINNYCYLISCLISNFIKNKKFYILNKLLFFNKKNYPYQMNINYFINCLIKNDVINIPNYAINYISFKDKLICKNIKRINKNYILAINSKLNTMKRN